MEIREHLPLAPRDLLVLSVLASGPAHGYAIIKAVEERSESGVLLDPANLYRVLKRMRSLGWLEDDPDAEGRRRTHRTTRLGREVLRAEMERLERLLGRTRPALADGGA